MLGLLARADGSGASSAASVELEDTPYLRVSIRGTTGSGRVEQGWRRLQQRDPREAALTADKHTSLSG